MIENGTGGSVAPVISSSTVNRQLAPAYHIPHNTNVMQRPTVTTATLPGVQAPVVRYQGPGNVAVVRPNTNLHMAGRAAGTAIAPAQPPHIMVATATVQGNTQIVKQVIYKLENQRLKCRVKFFLPKYQMYVVFHQFACMSYFLKSPSFVFLIKNTFPMTLCFLHSSRRHLER